MLKMWQLCSKLGQTAHPPSNGDVQNFAHRIRTMLATTNARHVCVKSDKRKDRGRLT